MSRLLQHLQKHIVGEVLESSKVLDYFSTDGSVLTLKPKIVVYPRHTKDVATLTRFCWELAERGQMLPITARGKGTDQAGGALGPGVMAVLPAHMKKMLVLDKSSVTVQPGIIYSTLQQTLHTHSRFLPPYPSSIEFSTIGGAVANNAAGEKTIKYGSTRDYVSSLEVVLANGEVIRAERLSKKQLNRKQGLTTLEGQIYRELDGLLEDNADLIAKTQPQVSKNSAGYSLHDIKGKDGSFDLTRLFVGSQGTLGTITEVTLKTEPYNQEADLLTAYFDDLEKAGQAVIALQKLGPSAMELVDRHLLEFLRKHKPQALVGFETDEALPAVVLLIEFDDASKRTRHKKARQAHRILDRLATQRRIIPNHKEQEADWMMRHSVAAIIWQDQGSKKALPIIEDGVVPVDKMPEFLDRAYKLLEKHHLDIAVWGHAGNANFHMQPFLDLSVVGDRQKVFKLMDDFYQMVLELGGSTCGEHNDGRLRAPYLPGVYGHEMYQLFREVKKIFDPFNILNPGVKIDVAKEDVRPLLRDEYSMPHLYDHMPKGS
jgi:FAD/FMN-containing dehydrogenase